MHTPRRALLSTWRTRRPPPQDRLPLALNRAFCSIAGVPTNHIGWGLMDMCTACSGSGSSAQPQQLVRLHPRPLNGGLLAAAPRALAQQLTEADAAQHGMYSAAAAAPGRQLAFGRCAAAAGAGSAGPQGDREAWRQGADGQRSLWGLLGFPELSAWDPESAGPSSSEDEDNNNLVKAALVLVARGVGGAERLIAAGAPPAAVQKVVAVLDGLKALTEAVADLVGAGSAAADADVEADLSSKLGKGLTMFSPSLPFDELVQEVGSSSGSGGGAGDRGSKLQPLQLVVMMGSAGP